jgi:ferredoxin like protein
MSEVLGLKEKLGRNVFKHNEHRHIEIKAGKERDPRLRKRFCMPGWSLQPQ